MPDSADYEAGKDLENRADNIGAEYTPPSKPYPGYPPRLLVRCDACGEQVPAGELVPRRDGPEPWLPTRWICDNCDDDAAQEANRDPA